MNSLAADPAIVKAQERIDAERGAELLNRLETSWIEQGYNARLMGLNRSDGETLWSPYHRRGWDLADQMIEAQLSETGTLDPMPIPMWDDMIEQAMAAVLA